MGKITTNLRKRIKEKGYTREQFADACGIPEETLKKYLSKDDYPTRWLKVFADKLDCTYDYLLGKSNVPERKYKDARNETGLSIQAIENLKKYDDIERETVNIFLENRDLFNSMHIYLNTNKEMNDSLQEVVKKVYTMFNLSAEDTDIFRYVDMEYISEISLVAELKKIKDRRKQK